MEFFPAGPDAAAALVSLETDVILAIFPIATGVLTLGFEIALTVAGSTTLGAATTGLGFLTAAGTAAGATVLTGAEGLGFSTAAVAMTAGFLADAVAAGSLGMALPGAGCALVTGLPLFDGAGLAATRVFAALTTLARPESFAGVVALGAALAALAGAAFKAGLVLLVLAALVALAGADGLLFAGLAAGLASFFTGTTFFAVGFAFLAATFADFEVFLDAMSPLRQLECSASMRTDRSPSVWRTQRTACRVHA